MKDLTYECKKMLRNHGHSFEYITLILFYLLVGLGKIVPVCLITLLSWKPHSNDMRFDF